MHDPALCGFGIQRARCLEEIVNPDLHKGTGNQLQNVRRLRSVFPLPDAKEVDQIISFHRQRLFLAGVQSEESVIKLQVLLKKFFFIFTQLSWAINSQPVQRSQPFNLFGIFLIFIKEIANGI